MESRVTDGAKGTVEFDGSYGGFGVGECETELVEARADVVGVSNIGCGEVDVKTEPRSYGVNGRLDFSMPKSEVAKEFSGVVLDSFRRKYEDSASQPKTRSVGYADSGGELDDRDNRVSYDGVEDCMSVCEVQSFPLVHSSYLGFHDANIAETSEMVLQAAKGLSYGFETGDMVWGKVKSHPWWPGHIYNEIFASSSVRKTRREGHVLVAFFGDSSYGWFDPTELIPFEPNYAEKSRQTSSRNFMKAVEEAVDEACRRAALGLACYCRHKKNYVPLNVRGYFSVDVFDYEPGGIYSQKQIKSARDNFQPAETLVFVKQASLITHNVDRRSIYWIKNVALLLAYRKAVFEEFDETYAQAFGIEPVRPSRNANSDLEQPDRVPPRAPLSGPLVIAEALGVRKSSGKSSKVKDSSKKDKYLFKRRDEPHETWAARPGQSHASHLKADSMSSVTIQDASCYNIEAGDYVLQKREPINSEKISMSTLQEKETASQECGPVSNLCSLEPQKDRVVSPGLSSVHFSMQGVSEEGEGQIGPVENERDVMSEKVIIDDSIGAEPVDEGTDGESGSSVQRDAGAVFVENDHSRVDQTMEHDGSRSVSVSAEGSPIQISGAQNIIDVQLGKTVTGLKRPNAEELTMDNHFLGERRKKKRKQQPSPITSLDEQQIQKKNVKDQESLSKLAGKSIGIGSSAQEHTIASSERQDGTSCSVSSSDFSELVVGNIDLELSNLVSDLLALAIDPFHGVENNGPAIVRHVFLKFRSLVYQKSLVLANTSESAAVRLLSGQRAANSGAAASAGEGRDASSFKSLRSLPKVDDPTKLGAKRAPSDRQEELSAKRMKKLEKLRQLSMEKKAGVQKSDGLLKVEQKETVAQGPSASTGMQKFMNNEPVKKPDLPLRAVSKPAVLMIKFPPATAIPSPIELKARFARFGPLDLTGTRIYWHTSTCKVVFKDKSDAQAAYDHAIQNNSLFGQVRVRYSLRDIKTPASELPEPSKVQTGDCPDGTQPSSSKPSITEAAGELRPPPENQQRQPSVQLKSCLKRPSADEAGPSMGISKESPRVKFLLGGDDGREQKQQTHVLSSSSSNSTNNGNSINVATSPSSIAFGLDVNGLRTASISTPPDNLVRPPHSSDLQHLLQPRAVPIPPFPRHPSRTTPDLPPIVALPSIPKGPQLSTSFRQENPLMPPPLRPPQQALAPNAVHYKEVERRKEAAVEAVDISHQMLSLLLRCSDIVTGVKSALGYVPYRPL